MLREGLSTGIKWRDSASNNSNLKKKTGERESADAVKHSGVCLRLLSTRNVHVGRSGSSSSSSSPRESRTVTAEIWMSSWSPLNPTLDHTDPRRTATDVLFVSLLLLTWVMWPAMRGDEIGATGRGRLVFLVFLSLQLVRVMGHLSAVGCWIEGNKLLGL